MDSEHGAGTGAGGEESALPPQAPAYDLRTGEPLNAPRADVPSTDFTATDLGIWAPSTARAAEPAARAAVAPDLPQQFGPVSQQSTPPPGYGPTAAARQPTPPPGSQPPVGPANGYGPSSPGVPGFPGQSTTAYQPAPPSPPARRGPLVLGGIVGVLVVVVAVLVAVLAFGKSSETPVASTTTGSDSSGKTSTDTGQSSTGQGSAGQSSGTSGGSTSDSSSDAARVAFLHTVDGILTQSASGRQQVSSVVTGVVNGCSVAPQTASVTIRQVIVNRQSVLGQANALSAPDSATAAVKADLVRALSASIDANRGYQQWLDNLYSTYYNAEPVGCPDGQAPTDANYDAATAASGRATAAKQSFVSAYNPLATSAGLRTWQESEF